MAGTLRRFAWIMIGIMIAGIGYYSAQLTAKQTDLTLQSSLITRVDTIGAAIGDDAIKQLSGTPSDLSTDAYKKIKRTLIKLRQVNPDVRFIYVMGSGDNGVFFYADSESPQSTDYSPPGQSYPEASPALMASFQNGLPFVEGPITDRWGEWLSALSPIHNTSPGHDHAVVGVVGMDVSNAARRQKITDAVRGVTTLTILAEGLLLLLYIYMQYKAKMKIADEDRAVRERQYQFISMLSHQLRTPISAARSMLELLKDEKGMETLNTAYEKMDHLNNIVNTLLFFIENKDTLNRKRLITEKDADAVAVINSQLKLLEHVIESKKITVTTHLPKTQILPIDEVLLNRIIYSILDNAVSYNKDHGTLDISLTVNDKHITLTVTDSGYGIPAKEQSKVFTSFFRATNASLGMNEGSGMSLYITKEIMRLYDGTISFTSIEDKGSTFTLKF